LFSNVTKLHLALFEKIQDSFFPILNNNLIKLSFLYFNKLTELPNSILKLKLLEDLNLNGCKNLKKLPNSLLKSKKLTFLDIT
jgi:Leucine-rich repeat (LRR) protein